MNRQQKEKNVAELQEKLRKANSLVLTDYKGMTVSELSQLRDTLRKSSIEYKVVKNTLARIASEGTLLAAAKDSVTGPVGIAIDYADAAVLTKEVLGFAKKNEKLKVTGGVVEGMFCTEAQLKAISQLPPREVLLSMLAGAMQAPLAKFGQLLTASVARFGHAMNALKDKKAAGQ